MKLLYALKEKGHPFEIPDCSRDDLPEFFKVLGFTKGAEIGVDNGDFSEKFCKAGLTLYAIDPWKEYSGYNIQKKQEKLNACYEKTKDRLAPYPNCKIIRKTSMEAVEDFEDESLDFVYIDGNHEFRYIAEDLAEWTKKVKKGGIVSGHDFFYIRADAKKNYWHVAHVLTAYIAAFGIPNWYLLGRKRYPEGEKRDKYRSWMFVKP